MTQCQQSIEIILPPAPVVEVQVVSEEPISILELGWLSPSPGDVTRELLGVYEAAEPISGSSLVYIMPDGRIIRADAAQGWPSRGFTLQACIEGDSVPVFVSGDLPMHLTGVPGSSAWLGIEGKVDAVPILMGRSILQELGFVSRSGVVRIDLEEFITL